MMLMVCAHHVFMHIIPFMISIEWVSFGISLKKPFWIIVQLEILWAKEWTLSSLIVGEKKLLKMDFFGPTKCSLEFMKF